MRSALGIYAAVGVALGLFVGCAVAADDADAEPGSAASEVTTVTVEGLAVIAPPELRVLTGPADSLLGPRVEGNRRVAAIRSLRLGGKKAKLVVDADSLVTSVVSEDVLAGASRASTPADDVATAPYLASLQNLATSGAALNSVDGKAPSGGADEPFTLTVDMCQSSKRWEKRLFDWAEKLSDNLQRPVPVGVAMTGGWAKAHGGELEELLSFEKRGKVAITWINHSSTHPLHCQNSSCSKAEFLTASSVDFDEEVLGLERALLQRSLVPSAIFRFPGLVHNPARMRQLSRLSLMAIDADAWIAKGQGIKPRAVVLVHGNGNEADGITGFLRQVESPSRAAALKSGKSALVSPLLIAPLPPR